MGNDKLEFRHNIVRGLRFHSHFDNVMTQFIIKRTSALKTDVNLLTRISRIETGFCHANFVVKAA